MLASLAGCIYDHAPQQDAKPLCVAHPECSRSMSLTTDFVMGMVTGIAVPALAWTGRVVWGKGIIPYFRDDRLMRIGGQWRLDQSEVPEDDRQPEDERLILKQGGRRVTGHWHIIRPGGRIDIWRVDGEIYERFVMLMTSPTQRGQPNAGAFVFEIDVQVSALTGCCTYYHEDDKCLTSTNVRFVPCI